MVNDNEESNGEKSKGNANGNGRFVKGDPRINRTGLNRGSKGLPALLKKIGATGAANAQGHKYVDDDGNPITRLERIANKLFEEAESGTGWAMQLLFDRLEGRPRQVLEVVSENEELGSMEDEALTGYFVEECRN